MKHFRLLTGQKFFIAETIGEQRLFVKKTNAKASYDNLRSSYCLDLTEIIIYSFNLRSIARYYLVHSYFKFQATKNLSEASF